MDWCAGAGWGSETAGRGSSRGCWGKICIRREYKLNKSRNAGCFGAGDRVVLIMT